MQLGFWSNPLDEEVAHDLLEVTAAYASGQDAKEVAARDVLCRVQK